MPHLIILFFATFSASLMAIVFPGLVNITAAKTSAQRGKTNGIIFAIGASLIVSLQAYIGVLISKYLYNNPFVIDILLKIALAVFAFFAIYFFIMAKKNKSTKKVRQVNIENKRINIFLKGMLIAALNVLPIAYFCGLNAAWNVSGWIKFQLWDILVFVIAAGMGTFAMLYMYVFYFDKLEDRTDTFSRYSDYIISALMALLLIITLIRLFYMEA
ncbi:MULTISPECIES: LysE family transporter [Galbibacter]|uniref:LysE family transporter n=1 Tax=Galbibacter pacificus TaxID=2996052 RepID=A0ABT6FWG7_9FLAO|nr:LysE family transporter [Galbibacter pacificus]MDG3583973.1 LysE family transporter [Galbibacter pacificus]MDG3587590.1 LysE family transporter [Galbibacter pacificus]